MTCYYVPLRTGSHKEYSKPTDSFWCCTGTGVENHAKYGESIYFKGEGALYVNLFIPSVLTWRERGVTLTQTTRFPDEAETTLRAAIALRPQHADSWLQLGNVLHQLARDDECILSHPCLWIISPYSCFC